MNNNADTVLKWFPMLIQTGTLVALGLATYFNIVANNKIIEQRLTALELSEKELTKERPEIARQLSELKIELVRLRTVIEEGNNK